MEVLALCEGVKRARVTCELSEEDNILGTSRLPASLEQLHIANVGTLECNQPLISLANWGAWQAPNLKWPDWGAQQRRLQEIADDGELVWTPEDDDDFMALGQRYPWQLDDPVCEYDDEDELFDALQDEGVQDTMDDLTQSVLYCKKRMRLSGIGYRFTGPYEGTFRGHQRNTHIVDHGFTQDYREYHNIRLEAEKLRKQWRERAPKFEQLKVTNGPVEGTFKTAGSSRGSMRSLRRAALQMASGRQVFRGASRVEVGRFTLLASLSTGTECTAGQRREQGGADETFHEVTR